MKRYYLIAGVLVAVLAACGGTEPAAEPSPPPATQPATSEQTPAETAPAETAPVEAATTAATTHELEPETSAEPALEPPTLVIQVRGSEPVGGMAEIEVKQGDEVDFGVESDVKGIVHVHGYNIEKKVTPSKPARLTFEATLEGIFEIELHLDGDETQIAELRVEP
jgi:plastocyanin